MRTILIIFIAAMVSAAGCSSARKARSGKSEPIPPATAEQQTPSDSIPEVAPFGNAALAGKPDEAEVHPCVGLP